MAMSSSLFRSLLVLALLALLVGVQQQVAAQQPPPPQPQCALSCPTTSDNGDITDDCTNAGACMCAPTCSRSKRVKCKATKPLYNCAATICSRYCYCTVTVNADGTVNPCKLQCFNTGGVDYQTMCQSDKVGCVAACSADGACPPVVTPSCPGSLDIFKCVGVQCKQQCSCAPTCPPDSNPAVFDSPPAVVDFPKLCSTAWTVRVTLTPVDGADEKRFDLNLVSNANGSPNTALQIVGGAISATGNFDIPVHFDVRFKFDTPPERYTIFSQYTPSTAWTNTVTIPATFPFNYGVEAVVEMISTDGTSIDVYVDGNLYGSYPSNVLAVDRLEYYGNDVTVSQVVITQY